MPKKGCLMAREISATAAAVLCKAGWISMSHGYDNLVPDFIILAIHTAGSHESSATHALQAVHVVDRARWAYARLVRQRAYLRSGD